MVRFRGDSGFNGFSCSLAVATWVVETQQQKVPITGD